MPNPPPTPAERFSAILRLLVGAVDTRRMYVHGAGPVMTLIMMRLMAIARRFRSLAARISAGTYRPRRTGGRRAPAARQPRRPDPLPRSFGWLKTLIPEATGCAGGLAALLAQPEMVALLAQAPDAMRRPVRSLCRMLGVGPPPILDRVHSQPIDKNPSPAKREREGPVAKRREGEGAAAEDQRPPSPPVPHACGPPLPRPA